MGVIIGLGVIFAIVATAVLGRGFGRSGLPPAIDGPVKGAAEGDCDTAGAKWDEARQNVCRAKGDEDAAFRLADQMRAQVVAATAAHLALVIAAAATYVAAAAATATFFGIPAGIVLTAIAVGLTVAAAAALLVLTGLSGALTAADDDVRAKIRLRQDWEAARENWRKRIMDQCPAEKRDAWLSLPGPC